MKELFHILKDHKNPMMQELVNDSYEKIFQREMESLFDDYEFDGDRGTENVVRCCVINPSYSSTLQEAIAKLLDAKLTIDLFGFHDESQGTTKVDDDARLSDQLTVLINDIGIAMKNLEYALFRGKIYKKKSEAKYTYAYKCEVSAFVNCLAANESFKGRLLKNSLNMRRVIDILADPDCEVIRPISVDYNLIEVNGGQCWSIKERRFLERPIPDEKIGLVTPRVFSKYDPQRNADPKYFREILENSLTDGDVSEFCDDFLKLLHFNQKRHKDKVPCLIGDANSGKTSLFQPVLGLVHHSNIATVTKQRAFNKAMINKATEVIFIDEASVSTMEIDDWKILTQGGYTAADVKYQTAKAFINRCPMLVTAQQKLQFKPEDQPAMDRRLRDYTFKSLPEPKRRAAEWLRKNPMHCVVWAAEKARRINNDDDSDDTGCSDEDQAANFDGSLPELEKDALRSLSLADALASNIEKQSGENSTGEDRGVPRESTDEERLHLDQDEMVAVLERALEQCSPMSLRYRQLSQMLQARLKEVQTAERFEERMYQDRRQNLLTRGVREEHVALLSRHSSDPLPTPIQRDLDAANVQARREELVTKRERAKKAFEAPWLQATERELQRCSLTLSAVLDRETRASMEAYRDVLQDKLKNHHQNLGTIKCEFALEARRRWCYAEGLLKKEDRHLVTTLVQTLPTVDDIGESSQDTLEDPSPASPEKNSDDEAMFITPVPSTSGHGRLFRENNDCERSEAMLRQSSTRKRKRPASSQPGNRKFQNTIMNYFSSQK